MRKSQGTRAPALRTLVHLLKWTWYPTGIMPGGRTVAVFPSRKTLTGLRLRSTMGRFEPFLLMRYQQRPNATTAWHRGFYKKKHLGILPVLTFIRAGASR